MFSDLISLLTMISCLVWSIYNKIFEYSISRMQQKFGFSYYWCHRSLVSICMKLFFTCNRYLSNLKVTNGIPANTFFGITMNIDYPNSLSNDLSVLKKLWRVKIKNDMLTTNTQDFYGQKGSIISHK